MHKSCISKDSEKLPDLAVKAHEKIHETMVKFEDRKKSVINEKSSCNLSELPQVEEVDKGKMIQNESTETSTRNTPKYKNTQKLLLAKLMPKRI